MKFKFLSTSLVLATSFFMGSFTSHASEIEPNLSEQIEFRAEFGLNTDLEIINSLKHNPQLYTENQFEIPLTKEEENELKQRFKKQNEDIPKIKEFLDNKFGNDNYSLYIDQKSGGEIVIKLKESENQRKIVGQRQLLENELDNLSSELSYKIEVSSYSESDLNQISEDIWEKKNLMNLDFDSTSVDLINEKIKIGIIDYSSEKEDTLKLALKEYPIEIIQVDPPSNHRSAYGGEQITNSRGGSCSAAYYATSGSNNYLVTAGHCSRAYNSNNGAVTNYYSDTYTYGSTSLGKVSSIKYGSKVDALTISVSSSNANSYININGAARKMTSSQARNGDTVGQAVCMVGYSTGKSQCGTLKSKNVGYEISGATFSGLRGTNLSSSPGDSGGTVYNSFQYVGINKGSGGGYTQVYSQIGEVNYELGLSTYLK